MRLSEVRGRSEQGQQRQPHQQQFNEQIGVIRTIGTFTRPIEGLYQGEPVTVLAAGDIVGMSPAALIVDARGKFDWVSLDDDLRATQKEVLPEGQEVQRLRQQARHQNP